MKIYDRHPPQTMTKETYYAVRVGIPGKHKLYFMVREGTMTPELFHCRRDAENRASQAPKDSNWEVVMVEVREIK